MKTPYDIYFYEAFAEEAAALRSFLPAKLHAGFTWKTIQEARDASPPAPIISVRTQSELPAGWGRAIDGLLTRSTGYDHVAAWLKALDAPVPAGYLPLYCNRAVAEQAALLWLALLRKLPQQVQQFERFHRDNITGRECKARAITVFGVGNIGSEVVKIARGLEMDVRGVDLVERHKRVHYVSPRDGLLHADIIVCAMNLTPVNDRYFCYDTLRLVKPGALFINIARGEFSPAGDLLRLLEEGTLAGVGLDVYAEEKTLAVALRDQDPDAAAITAVADILALTRRSDVIALPHNAFNTLEAVQRKAEQSIDAIRAFRHNGSFPHPVSPLS
ncbi:MAG: hydroxyacid dehydrogenase [Lentisphaerae bacterium]|nr:hydroxyacid dehydrogenase [Lentisphaerota bacterium]